ncbi:MAG TPA: response regulator [Bacteroidales bacterium]|nr:response regulator [Bacteroidales bacterium]
MKLKILIAEDDGFNALLLQKILKGFCKEFLVAKSGKQAMDLLAKNKDVDLVVTDIEMPEMNGFELLNEIRQKNKKIPVIAQTSIAQNIHKRLFLLMGFTGFLAKPIIREDLVDLVSRIAC